MQIGVDAGLPTMRRSMERPTLRRMSAATGANTTQEASGMADFYKRSLVRVIDFSCDARARRLFRAFPLGADVATAMRQELLELHAGRARRQALRQATDAEDLQYVRADLPRNVLCPTGR
ncbi:hypothetical protein J2W39_002978 [Variovorax paradoxus]|uniref:Uncharacterized protein n=1 Tax=Variovorax paradoxus TaxID=34073 RepID=A0AAW8EIA4_VARPD|nr:hypothetical protein [Variovorax paradoxus]MDP9971736.1 hypothetical protein [Variovorax paradoxus]